MTVAAEDAVEEESANAANTAARVGSRAWFHGGYATAQIFLATLFATNPVYNFVKGCGGSDDLAMWLNLGANLAATLVTFKAASTGQTFASFSQRLSNGSKLLDRSMKGLIGISTLGQYAYTGSSGYVQMQTAGCYDQIAPLQQDLTILKAMSTVNNSMFGLSQEALKQVLSEFETLFGIDFSFDWKATAQGVTEIAG
jgi:hypothetical protein